MSRKSKCLTWLFWSVIVICLFGACNSGGNDCDQSPENPQVTSMKITRLDEQLLNTSSKDEVIQLLKENPAFTRWFLDSDQYPNLDELGKNLYGISQNASIDTLYKETKEVFGNLEALESELTKAYSWLKYYYPAASVPELKIALTGLYNDLYVSDSVIVIGLEYFIGKEATFRPMNTPEYILKRYEKESILPLIFSFVSNDFMAIDSRDNTLLADMINYGRSYYFTKQMMPCKPDGWIVGYNEEEIRLVSANQETIWGHFINRELFYETSHFIKNKYTGERPNVFEIGDQCPGRIARWLGWQIVKAYMEQNPEVSLADLMVETDAQKILNKSKFKAKNQ